VGGLYYSDENDQATLTSIAYPGAARTAAQASVAIPTPNTLAISRAVFGNATIAVLPRVKLDLGARYTQDQKELTQNFSRFLYANPATTGTLFAGTAYAFPYGAMAANFPFIARVDPTFSAFTPKAGIEWQMTDAAFLYFNFTKGFKSGGNNYASTSLLGISYLPEKVTSYEAGARTGWLDNHLFLNLTGFRYDYTNLQVQANLAPGVTSINNAPTATIDGVEFEAVARPTAGLRLSANASYLNARYGSYLQAQVPNSSYYFIAQGPGYNAASNTYNASGNRLTNAPRFSSNLAAQYTMSTSVGEVYGRAEYYYQTRAYYDPSNVKILSQGPYGIANLAVGYHAVSTMWGAQFASEERTGPALLQRLRHKRSGPVGCHGRSPGRAP